MVNFFIDTADVDYIANLWDKIVDHIDVPSFLGVTTNPNAMYKVGVSDLSQFERRVRLVGELVHDCREVGGDDSFIKGLVYVQIPNSQMTLDEIEDWIRYVQSLAHLRTEIALKIPPRLDILRASAGICSRHNNISLNVTGVADCATALRCFSYPAIRHVSLIPGRMESVGIDANAHVIYTQQRSQHNLRQKVITGSMRTVDQLLFMCETGTVPTIGNRVWDEFFSGEYEWSLLRSVAKNTNKFPPITWVPKCDQDNVDLSCDFFDTMDELGNSLYSEFIGD